MEKHVALRAVNPFGVEVGGHAQGEVEADPGELKRDSQNDDREKFELVLVAPGENERRGGDARLQHGPDDRRAGRGRATEELEREDDENRHPETSIRRLNEAPQMSA